MNMKFASFVMTLMLAAMACALPGQYQLVRQVPASSDTLGKANSTPTLTAEPSHTPTATPPPPTQTATPRPPTKTPTPIVPMARVTSDGPVNIRSGACYQSVLTTASRGMEFPVTGRYTTASGQVWWRIQLPAGNVGWIWGALVEVTHDSLIPFVPSECPPFPTATPSLVIEFTLKPDRIAIGECAELEWRVEGVQDVYLWVDFDVYPVSDEQTYVVCPAYTTEYSLDVMLPNGDVLIRTLTLIVTP